jgi:hypothetical protein
VAKSSHGNLKVGPKILIWPWMVLDDFHKKLVHLTFLKSDYKCQAYDLMQDMLLYHINDQVLS